MNNYVLIPSNTALSTSDQSATSDSDYTAFDSSTTVMFGVDESEAMTTLDISGDTDLEENEQLEVAISDITTTGMGNHVMGQLDKATVVIQNDDVAESGTCIGFIHGQDKNLLPYFL